MKNKINNIWYYIKSYKYDSLLIRNFILIFLLFVIPVGSIAAGVYANTNDMMKEEVTDVSINSLYRVKDMIDTVFNDIERLATKISLEPDVQVFMISDSPERFDAEKKKSILDKTNAYPLIYKYISSIYIYSERKKYQISNSGGGNFEVLDDTTWYDAYSKKKDNDPWIQARRHNNIYPYYITIAKPAGVSYVSDSMGAVVININTEELGKMLLSTENNVSENIFILDKNGTILYNKDYEKITKNIQSMSVFDDIKAIEGDYSAIKYIDKQKFVIVSVPSRYHEGRYVSLIPFATFQKRLNRISAYMIALLIVCSIVTLFFSYIISVKTYKPVQSLLSFIDNPVNWMDKSANDRKSKYAEIKHITDRIMGTIYSNKELQEELDKRMKLMKKAQSSALQAQINPHFLYNTLESINWKAIRLTKGRNDVSRMLTLLSNLLRLSMDINEPLTTIAKEIEHAKSYIDIIKMRYANKVNVIWNIDESILEYKIIKLILQPIIENAVYHGIKPKRQDGTIKIEGSLIENAVEIKVSDDGVGMDEEHLKILNTSMKQDIALDSEHIGLLNVNQRIRLMFGNDFGISVESIIDKGMVVKIKVLPLR